MNVAVVDYKVGNQTSVLKCIEKLGFQVSLINQPKELDAADKIILPGVGHFATAINNLHTFGLWDELHEQVLIRKKPVLGICLGMQIMAEDSEEAEGSQGLGWIAGSVKKLSVKNSLRYKIPHIAWASLSFHQSHPLAIAEAQDLFYFTHSYSYHPVHPEHILCTSRYEAEFVSGVVRENMVGFQFHPEKSHNYGQNLLKKFLEI